MTITEAIIQRERNAGNTIEQIAVFGAAATIADIAEILGVSTTTARKRCQAAVKAGEVKPRYTHARRDRLRFAIVR